MKFPALLMYLFQSILIILVDFFLQVLFISLLIFQFFQLNFIIFKVNLLNLFQLNMIKFELINFIIVIVFLTVKTALLIYYVKFFFLLFLFPSFVNTYSQTNLNYFCSLEAIQLKHLNF